MKRLFLLLLVGCSSFWVPEPSRPAPIVLLAPDGDMVARLDPAPYRADDGTLPDVIHYKGRAYKRCWTNEGNTDKDERLWCEVKPAPPPICEHAAPPKGCFWLLDKGGDCAKDKLECLGANPPCEHPALREGCVWVFYKDCAKDHVICTGDASTPPPPKGEVKP